MQGKNALVKSSLIAVLSLIPGNLLAGELKEGTLNYGQLINKINPGELISRGYFDPGQAGQLDFVGARIIVQGKKDNKLVAREIEITPGVEDPKNKRMRAPIVGSDRKYAIASTGGVGVLYTTFSKPSACAGGDLPILATGQEGNYHIQWCKNSSPTPPAVNAAKKNYYYMFSNGDYQLVLTQQYDCAVPSDKQAMPPPVVSGIPCP